MNETNKHKQKNSTEFKFNSEICVDVRHLLAFRRRYFSDCGDEDGACRVRPARQTQTANTHAARASGSLVAAQKCLPK